MEGTVNIIINIEMKRTLKIWNQDCGGVAIGGDAGAVHREVELAPGVDISVMVMMVTKKKGKKMIKI